MNSKHEHTRYCWFLWDYDKKLELPFGIVSYSNINIQPDIGLIGLFYAYLCIHTEYRLLVKQFDNLHAVPMDAFLCKCRLYGV